MLPPCPKCQSSYTYEVRQILNCPECGHEWSLTSTDSDSEEEMLIVKDANGTQLQDGDSVTIIKDLNVKGSSSVIKIGTKVNNIKLVEGDHNIDCKIKGIGEMKLKSEFVKFSDRKS